MSVSKLIVPNNQKTADQFKADLMKTVGDISDIEVYNNQVLVALHLGPAVTPGGVMLPQSQQDEAIYQGKTGCIIKLGPQAFKPDPNGQWQWEDPPKVGDWVWSRSSDGWNLRINGRYGAHCRLIMDTSVRGRIAHPESIW